MVGPSFKKVKTYDSRRPLQWTPNELYGKASHQSYSTPRSSRPQSPETDGPPDFAASSSTDVTFVLTPANHTAEHAKKNPKTNVISPWKPQSKTALGRLIYHLSDLPQLFVVKIEIKSLESGTGNSISAQVDVADPPTVLEPSYEGVGSRKLRVAAIIELLNDEDFRSIAHIAVVNSRVGKFHDHIIVPIRDREHEQHLQNLFRPRHIRLAETKKEISQTESRELVGIIGERIPNSTMGDANQDAEMNGIYWKNLDVYIRARASYLDTGSWYNIDRDFRTATPYCKIQKFDIYVRYRPTLDRMSSTLRLDFDLVPYVPQGRTLAQVLIDLYGPAILNSDVKDYLPRIKNALSGLDVRCGYRLVRTNANGDDYMMTKIFSPDTRPRQFQIGKLALPGEVDDFFKDGKRYSVHKYFNAHLSPGDQLKYSHLPYAYMRAGKGKESWIALELLIVDFKQPLARFGCLVPDLQKKVGKFQATKGEQALREIGERFVRSFKEVYFDPDDSSKCSILTTMYESVVFLLPVTPAEKHLEVPHLKDEAGHNKRGTIGIIHVEPEDDDLEKINILQDVAERIRTRGISNSITSQCTVNNFDDLRWVDHADSLLNPLVVKPPSILFCIIDKRKRTKSDVRNIIGELRHLGERRLGCLVVTATTQHLRKLISQKPQTDKHYFPETLRAKMNFMQGGRNYKSSMPTNTGGHTMKGAMIVGAHVAQEDRTASGVFPAIASVVATKDHHGLHYLGSARYQETHKKGDEADPIPKNAIRALREMMIERFKAWGKDPPPASILFYRNALNFDDPAISMECDEIKNAWQAHYEYDSQFCLTYIVVNRNTDISQPTAEDRQKPKAGKKQKKKAGNKQEQDAEDTQEQEEKRKQEHKLLFGFSDIDDPIPKYQYYVYVNAHGFREDGRDLKETTRTINISSQLVCRKQQASYALPVKFAEKLARRVKDYYRTWFKRMHEPNINTVWEEENATSGDNDGGARSELPEKKLPRALPWHPELDNHMFYL